MPNWKSFQIMLKIEVFIDVHGMEEEWVYWVTGKNTTVLLAFL